MEKERLNTPIAFIIFNRPNYVERVMRRIRAVRPKKLYVIADSARPGKKKEEARCAEARLIVEQMIDWPCELRKNYSHVNMGCRWRVSTGISWVFDHEEKAIILEDDCLPHVDFFLFCQEMLSFYNANEKVMQICGTNRLGYKPENKTDYFFSNYAAIWGWATWKRAWALYDASLDNWYKKRDTKDSLLKAFPKNVVLKRDQQLHQIYLNQLDTWDFAWLYTIMINRGLSIIPKVNMVRNIGFGLSATHTFNPIRRDTFMRTKGLSSPYIGPHIVEADVLHDSKYIKRFFGY